MKSDIENYLLRADLNSIPIIITTNRVQNKKHKKKRINTFSMHYFPYGLVNSEARCLEYDYVTPEYEEYEEFV